MSRKKKKSDNSLQMSLFTEKDFEQLLAEQQEAENPKPEEDVVAETPEPEPQEEIVSPIQDLEAPSEPETPEEEITEVDCSVLVKKMQETLRIMEYTSPNTIRLIALESSIIYKNGLQLNQKYTLKALPNKRLNWYEFVALYYCSFAHAFPTMLDKINQQYMDCYQEAAQIFEL